MSRHGTFTQDFLNLNRKRTSFLCVQLTCCNGGICSGARCIKNMSECVNVGEGECVRVYYDTDSCTIHFFYQVSRAFPVHKEQ